jgi:ABC-type iron transport system FetAB permease component
MDLTILTSFTNILIVGICLCTGYIIKHSLDFIPNKYIPLIMACLGLTLSICTNLDKITLEVILTGLFSGLASTGLHEAFKNLIKGGE